ncbi:hypothetical protein BGX34_002372 [Mortierella sp. NVP85]|nr:hypothetical protein BGX34_002372 [Mortierella sp. NVP85]
MRSSFVAAIAAVALTATTEASSRLQAYNADYLGGFCASMDVLAYDTCYTLSTSYQPKSASYFNDDFYANQITVIFFETANCGGKSTRYSSVVPYGTSVWWGRLGVAGSFVVQKSKVDSGNGEINQYLRATSLPWTSC